MVRDGTPQREQDKLMSKITRRDVLKASGTATGAAMLGVGSVQAHGRAGDPDDADYVDTEETDVTVTHGTNVAPTASPDGESIVMDLHGFLFRFPRDGGHAEVLTDVELEPARPDYAPDGSRIAFQAYAAGDFDIWTIASDGADLRQLTDDFWDDREPKWSPDGSQIAFSSDRGETYDIWTIDVATGDLDQWTDDSAENYEPSWSPDGTEITYVSNPAGEYADVTNPPPEKIKAVNQDGGMRTLVSATTEESLYSPSWSPDGEDVAYVRKRNESEGAGQIDLMVSDEQVTNGEDVFIFTPDWLSADTLLYSADGAIRTLDLQSEEASDIPFSATFHLPGLDYDRKSYFNDEGETHTVQGIQTPALSPDGESIVFVSLNDLWMMDIGQSPYRITDDEAYKTDPAWSPDGRYVVYSSDTAGTQDLYMYDIQTETTRRVTSLDDAAVSAAWSPDASKIAFQNQDRATFTVEVDISEDTVKTGEVQQVKGELFLPGQPTWSANGNTLALAALHSYSDRFRSGSSQILTVNVETGEENYYPPGEKFDSLSTRGDDGPVWSPDGRWMAFVVESTLRVMPVDETGKPVGPAEEITDETTDSPSWSGNSEWILYLHNGQLKKVKRDGSVTKKVSPVDLEYQRAQPSGRTLIYAGHVWDGTSPEVHNDVTITVVDNRIETVEPDTEPPTTDYVDASALTAIPGLWDTHVHHTYDERFFGDRQGRINLAYGVTSTVSRGDRVYRALEARESLKSGNRVGPRFFATGEPIDGSRVYYGFIGRPTTSIEQVAFEMRRAVELDYDFVKTYVRLNAKRMRLATDIAHDTLGVASKSHYFAPGSFVGQDGTTHLSATQRLGYARTESATSQTYEDIIKLYGQGERSAITTFFNPDFILNNEIQGDLRTQLFPPWDREELLDDVADNTAIPADPDCDTTACRHSHTFKDIMDNGGRILTGTDAPLDYFGVGVHENLRALEAYAFSPYEALLTATRLPPKEFGLEEDLGTLEAGKLADMVFVEDNPLEQIEDAIQVRMTMKNGELYPVEDLVEPFTEKEQNEEMASYYQVDFVASEPIEKLRGPNGTYTRDELIRFAHGSSDEPIMRRSDGEFTTDSEIANRIDSHDITVEDDTAKIHFTVADGSEPIELSLVSYTKPGPGWSPETEHQQEFVDAETDTFSSGTHTLSVELPTEESSASD